MSLFANSAKLPRATIALPVICLLLLLTGCATTNECEPFIRTVEVPRDRPVPVSDELTKVLPPITLKPETWLEGIEWGVLYQKRSESYEARLEAIRKAHGGQ